MLKKLTALAMGLCLSMPAMAVDVATLTQQAENGDKNAQAKLADYYDDKQDYQQAFNWYQKSANQGYATAQYNLGVMYRDGQGVRQDYQQAFNWYQKSANQGYAAAQNNLGVMYDEGQGVRQNKVTAKEWFGKACDNGEQKGCDNYKLLNQ